jgi:osmotically-inducible protein OsmY
MKSFTFYSGLATFNEDDLHKKPVINDSKLKSTVLSRLRKYSNTQLENITIHVDKGLIYLSGNVSWGYQKIVVASIVQRVDGVKGVINKITIAN